MGMLLEGELYVDKSRHSLTGTIVLCMIEEVTVAGEKLGVPCRDVKLCFRMVLVVVFEGGRGGRGGANICWEIFVQVESMRRGGVRSIERHII